MKPDMGKLLKQAQQMQQRLQQMQAEMENTVAEGTAGGGMVKAVVNGKHELVSIHIEKDVADPNDLETLQDLVVAAVNVANRNIQDKIQGEISKLTGGMPMPGMF